MTLKQSDSSSGVVMLEKLMDEDAISQSITRFADAIISKPDFKNVVIMGMATRGVPIAERIVDQIASITGYKVDLGIIDASFYRDDFHYRIEAANPQMTIREIPQSIEGRHVVLVDDVLYTGRSVRAAINAVFDLGRPASISLCVLVDRGCRELPICADYVGKTITTEKNQEVRVSVSPIDDVDDVWLVEVGA